MQQSDLIRLRHMLDAAREAVAFSAGRGPDDFRRDRVLTLALVKCIEIIGEAASRVSAETRAAHGGIPWSEAVAMRNRLVHGYFDVDLDRVWDTVVDDLARLVPELQRAVVAGETEGSC